MNMHPLICEISYIYFLLLFLASTIPRAATPINAAFVTNCVSTPVFTLPVFVLFVVVASFFFSSSWYIVIDPSNWSSTIHFSFLSTFDNRG